MNDLFVKKWLQWVLDFVGKDISKLSRLEKRELLRELIFFATDGLFNRSWDPFGKGIELSENQIIQWETIAIEIQIIFKEFLNVITVSRASYGLPELASWIRPEGMGPISPNDHRIYFQLHFSPKDRTPQNWAIINLCKLIQGIEVHVIGKCEECGTYFLNFSLRNKIYCTSPCASRSTARSRRERIKQDPKKWKAYLEKQAKLTMKNYIQKREREGKKVRHRRAPGKKTVVKNVVTRP